MKIPIYIGEENIGEENINFVSKVSPMQTLKLGLYLILYY